jgi:hypothetical protein
MSNHPVTTQPRPGRPFGLTLAIVATTMIYSVVPLLQLGFDLLLMNHFRTLDMSMPWNEGDEVVFAGANADIVSAGDVVLVSVSGIAFLVVAFFAWRGKPAWSRYLLFFGVLGLNALYLVVVLSTLLRPVDLSQGFTSADELVRSSQIGYLLMMSLVTVYLVWYMNRAPARAFYRGYYLPAEQGYTR